MRCATAIYAWCGGVKIENVVRDARRVLEAIETGKVSEEAAQAAERLLEHLAHGGFALAAAYIAIARGALGTCKPACPESVRRIVEKVVEELVEKARKALRNLGIVAGEKIVVVAPPRELRDLLAIAEKLAERGLYVVINDGYEALIGKDGNVVTIRRANNEYIVEYGGRKWRFRSMLEALMQILESLKMRA